MAQRLKNSTAGKNIVICMDGTGNRGGKTRGTNVWRIFNSVDRNHCASQQITYYDDGVGSDGYRLFRLLAGAFGIGLSRKIRDAYAFLAENYENGDRIYMFGFSRGAFAARSLAGMICRCGLLKRERFITERQQSRNRMVKRVLAAYRSEKDIPKWKEGGDPEHVRIRRCLGIEKLPLRRVRIHFIGVWDTVDAVGGTLGGLSALDWLWRKLLKRRWWGFHDLDPHPDISSAFHALALDDERKTFHPKIWNYPNASSSMGDSNQSTMDSTVSRRTEENSDQIVQQVWFAGVHSNVGGGYPKDSLSLVPLLWMMCRAHERGLRFLESRWVAFYEAADPHGRLYDSRAGFAAFYRYGRRKVNCQGRDPTIHASVLERIERSTDRYAPKALRKKRAVVVPEDCEPRSRGGECGIATPDGPDAWLSRFAKTRARLYWLTIAFYALAIGLLSMAATLVAGVRPIVEWPAALTRFLAPGLPASLVDIAMAFPVPGLLLVVAAFVIGWMNRRIKVEEGECSFRSWASHRPDTCKGSSQGWEPVLSAWVIARISPVFLLLAIVLATGSLFLLAAATYRILCSG